MSDDARERIDNWVGLLETHGCPDVAREAVLVALERGLDVEKIMNIYVSRNRYQGLVRYKDEERLRLLEFDGIVADLRERL